LLSTVQLHIYDRKLSHLHAFVDIYILTYPKTKAGDIGIFSTNLNDSGEHRTINQSNLKEADVRHMSSILNRFLDEVLYLQLVPCPDWPSHKQHEVRTSLTRLEASTPGASKIREILGFPNLIIGTRTGNLNLNVIIVLHVVQMLTTTADQCTMMTE
jgi:hypothetical protein